MTKKRVHAPTGLLPLSAYKMSQNKSVLVRLSDSEGSTSLPSLNSVQVSSQLVTVETTPVVSC